MKTFQDYIEEKQGLTDYSADEPLTKKEADKMHHILSSQGFKHSNTSFPQQSGKEEGTVTKHEYTHKSGSKIHVSVTGHHSVGKS